MKLVTAVVLAVSLVLAAGASANPMDKYQRAAEEFYQRDLPDFGWYWDAEKLDPTYAGYFEVGTTEIHLNWRYWHDRASVETRCGLILHEVMHYLQDLGGSWKTVPDFDWHADPLFRFFETRRVGVCVRLAKSSSRSASRPVASRVCPCPNGRT